VSVIYRLALPESRDFEPETFGTLRADRAEFLADVEAGSGARAPDRRLYEVVVTMGGTDLSERPIEDFLPLVENERIDEALPRLREFLLEEAKREGRPWMQLVAPREPRLHEAVVYVGDQTISTRPASA
jgi:hypothetical protein